MRRAVEMRVLDEKGRPIEMAYSVKRKIDSLGRIVLPIELRRALDLECDDEVVIRIEDEKIVIEPLDESCIFCGSDRNLRKIGKYYVCQNCVYDILTQD